MALPLQKKRERAIRPHDRMRTEDERTSLRTYGRRPERVTERRGGRGFARPQDGREKDAEEASGASDGNARRARLCAPGAPI